MNCSLGCMKCLVFVFNIVYAIVGVALLSMGTIFFTQELETGLDPDTNTVATETIDALNALTQGAIFFLITGVIAILLAIAGCFSAFKENAVLMRVVAAILLVLAVIQIIISGISFAASNNENILPQAKQKITNNLLNYSVDEKFQRVQAYLEEKYHCCGGKNYGDYTNNTIEIPHSCCILDVPCDTRQEIGLKDKGCSEAVAEKVVFLYKTVGAVSTILYILEIIGATGAYFLSVTIVNAKRRGTFT